MFQARSLCERKGICYGDFPKFLIHLRLLNICSYIKVNFIRQNSIGPCVRPSFFVFLHLAKMQYKVYLVMWHCFITQVFWVKLLQPLEQQEIVHNLLLLHTVAICNLLVSDMILYHYKYYCCSEICIFLWFWGCFSMIILGWNKRKKISTMRSIGV